MSKKKKKNKKKNKKLLKASKSNREANKLKLISKIQKKKQSEHDKQLDKLYSCTKIFKNRSKIPEYKKFKWVVIFMRNVLPDHIHNHISGFFLRKKFKADKQNHVWGRIKDSIIDKEQIGIKELPETHVKALIKELQFVKFH